MSRHFQAIGFELTNAAELKELARTAVEKGKLYRSGRKGMPEAVFLWDLGRGLQVWVGTNRADQESMEILSCLPGFAASAVTEAALRAYRFELRPERPGEVFLRGRFEDGAEIDAHLLNLAFHDDLPSRGLELKVILTGLVLSRDEAALPLPAETQDKADTPSPARVFVSVDHDAHGLVSGRIDAAREVVNFHTGAKLVAFTLDAGHGLFTLIGPSRLFPKLPEPGEPFNGMIWLTAQLP